MATMQHNELRSSLRGVIAFPVNPFKKDLSLDLDGLRKNLRAVLKHPICAVVEPEGTGEVYSLSAAEHLAVVRTTIDEVAGKVPVLAGAGVNPPPLSSSPVRPPARGLAGSSHFPRTIRVPMTMALSPITN